VDFLGRRRAGCDQARVDLVVLGPLQHELGIGPHLRGLEHDDHEAIAAQPCNNGLLVAAARLDADPFDAVALQPGRQRSVAIRSVIDLQLRRTFIERGIELAFAGIDAGADHAMLTHLRRPFLVMRTLGSFNHTGQMKSRPRSCYANSPCGCGGQRSDDRRLGSGGRPGRAVPCGTNAPYSFALIQGWAKVRATGTAPTTRTAQHRAHHRQGYGGHGAVLICVARLVPVDRAFAHPT